MVTYTSNTKIKHLGRNLGWNSIGGNIASTQALALTRSKSPSSSEISVKKELSLSPPHHQQFQQHQPPQQLQQPQLQIARDTQSASSTSLSSVGGGGADGGGGGSGGGGSGQPTEKNQSNMFSMKHHLNQIAQQNHQNQSQALDHHESPSPNYARRSAEASPVPPINHDHGAAAAAAAAAATAMASSHSGGFRPLAMSVPKIETPTPSLSENGASGASKSAGPVGGGVMAGSGVAGNMKMKRSPSIEPREYDVAKDIVKLRCIVESVHSSQASLLNDTRNVYKRRPNIESDCCVDVGTATLWKDIVNTALHNLGYSMEVASTARGSLIIKNWKPIPLENISDNPVVQVGDILGELASVITLRILILRAKSSPFGEIKDKLLRLLVLQSHTLLRSSGCPLDEVILSQICRSSYQSSYDYTGEISDDLRRKFDQWWSNQLSPQSPIAPKMLPFMAAAAAAGAPHQPSGMDFSTVGQMAAAAAAARSLHHTNRDNLLGDSHQPPPPPPHHLHPSMIVHPVMHPHPMHPHHGSYPTNQKTRMRTSFDPEMELPKLQKWFQENPHPSRQQIQTYVMQLNSLESRRGRKPLDVNNVVYWFKNARAAQKRAEMRGGVGQMPGAGMGGAGGPLGAGHSANGYLNHHAQQMMSHDYMKSPMSLKSDDIDTMSQHSDDMDDEHQSRPISPQLPLSLTMHERNRSPDDGRSSMGKDDVTSNHNGSTAERNSHSAGGGANEDLPNGNADRHSDVETHSQHGESNNNNNNSSNNNNNTSINNSSLRSLDERCESPKHSHKSEDLEMDDDNDNDNDNDNDFGTPSPDLRKDIFPMVSNAMFPQSLMYMTYMPGFGQPSHHPHHPGSGMHPSVPMGTSNLSMSNISSEERRKRNRTFIDPVTEVPKLEQWFSMQSHPSHNMIIKYTEDLNTMPYRQKFPRLESKNVQFWFKNRRAKNKRLKSIFDPQTQCGQLGGINSFGLKYEERD